MTAIPRTENRRSEWRLAFVLVAPAAMVMLAVTAYPIGYAVWLSLQRNNLTTPNDTEFIGLGKRLVGQARAVQVGGDHAALYRTVEAVASAVARTLLYGAQRRRRISEHGPAAMVLETGQRPRQPGQQRRADHLPDGANLLRRGGHVE